MTLTRSMMIVVALLGGGWQAMAAEPASTPFADEPFPIAIYAVPDSDEAFSQVKSWGATHVHLYSMGRSIEADQAYYDRAASHGLKVMAGLRGKTWVAEDDGLETMRAYVQHFKSHPAMGFWYLYDEPDRKHKPEELKPFYDMLKAETPDIPVAVAHAWTERWYTYGDVQDVLMNDIYPVTGEPFPDARLNIFTKFTESALKGGDAVVPVLQMFNWQSMAKEEDQELRGYPVDELRYPNPAEMRYMAFAPIAQGVRGLGFYSYARSMMTDRGWADEVLAPAIQEVKGFAEQVADADMQRLRRAEDEDLYLSVWEGDEETFVILASAWPKARQVRRSTGGVLKSGTLEPWGQTRDAGAELVDGRIVVEEVQPWEVFIWRVVQP